MGVLFAVSSCQSDRLFICEMELDHAQDEIENLNLTIGMMNDRCVDTN